MSHKLRQILCPVLLAFAVAPFPQALMAQGLYDMQRTTPYQRPYPSNATQQAPETYGQQVGHKALSGLANLATGVVEIPKNVINTTNSVNLAWGVSGGLLKGILNMLGRTLSGAVDLLTAPIPTYPIPNPEFVWNDFGIDTTYGDVFRLRERARPPAVTQAPVAEPAPPPAAPEEISSEPLDSAAERVEDAAHETDQKLDSMFKHYMTK